MSLVYVKGKTFKNETVPIDGTHFIDSNFVGCTLIYGGGDWGWSGCKFEGCAFNFQGAADRTAKLIKHVEAVGRKAATVQTPKGAPN